MKVTVDAGNVTRGGCVRRERRFNMKPTAKSFQILSAGIYTDHIAAILRELGCNSMDSHAWAGKHETPIRVHMPNTLEPFLSIEDDGVGLDDVEVRGQYVCPNCDHTEDSDFDGEVCPECGCKLSEANYEPGIYTTYFDSDKTDDDEVTGCLGLGSKTPLAYTDQFSVTAVKNGIRNVYSAFLDETGCPAIVRLHTEQTTDGNGVRVELGIKPDDFDKFINKAGYVYQWFKVRPEITGVDEFDYPEDQTFLMETDDYGIVDKSFDRYSSGGSTAVLMGNVRYALNYSDFDHKTREKFTEIETMLLKHGVFLKVSLDEGCDVAASREKLQMTKRSVETIKAKLAVVEADCLAEVQRRIDECTTIWDARIKYGELMDRTILGAIAKKSDIDPEWNGRECHPFVKFSKWDNVEYLDYPTDDTVGSPTFGERLPGPPQQSSKKVEVTMARGTECYLRSKERRRRYDGSDYLFDKTNGKEGIRIASDVRIFVQDVAHGSYAAVERLLREDDNVDRVYLLTETDTYTLSDFLKETGLNEVVKNVSTLPKPERASRGRGPTKKTAKAVKFIGDRYSNPMDCWEDHKIDDLDAGGVYVEVHRYSWKAGLLSDRYNGEYFAKPDRLSNHVSEARKLGLVGHVIGLRKALVEKVKDNPNWVRLDDYIIEQVKALAELADDAAAYGVWTALADNNQTSKIMKSFENGDWAVTSKLGSLIRETAMFKACGTDEVKNFKAMRNEYGYLVDGHLPDGIDYTSVIDGLKRQWETILDHYPMMEFVDFRWDGLTGSRLATVTDYINTLDGHTPIIKNDDDSAAAA